jgi:hypothetical protein
MCPPPMTGGCGAGQPFPTFTKACTNTMSCSFGFHQVDCCGTFVAVGFNHDQRSAFDAAETAWEATCPACGCAAQPTKADDGKTCAMNVVTVECTNGGMCLTRCP